MVGLIQFSRKEKGGSTFFGLRDWWGVLIWREEFALTHSGSVFVFRRKKIYMWAVAVFRGRITFVCWKKKKWQGEEMFWWHVWIVFKNTATWKWSAVWIFHHLFELLCCYCAVYLSKGDKSLALKNFGLAMLLPADMHLLQLTRFKAEWTANED